MVPARFPLLQCPHLPTLFSCFAFPNHLPSHVQWPTRAIVSGPGKKGQRCSTSLSAWQEQLQPTGPGPAQHNRPWCSHGNKPGQVYGRAQRLYPDSCGPSPVFDIQKAVLVPWQHNAGISQKNTGTRVISFHKTKVMLGHQIQGLGVCHIYKGSYF